MLTALHDALTLRLAVLTDFVVLPHGIGHVPLQLLACHAPEVGVPVKGVEIL